MPSALIVGSGPSAAGAALALAADPAWQITVVDVGLELEPHRREAAQHLARHRPESWPANALSLLAVRPEPSSVAGLPEKRVFGSDYPFRDAGQRRGLVPGDGITDQLISGAYGGFSTVWGAVTLPFPSDAFSGWPFGEAELAPHYRSVLASIPYGATEDDLAEGLPLYAQHAGLPALSARGQRIHQRYQRHRSRLRKAGLTMGRTRLAVRVPECQQCGLCMTGCPYGIIYSAAQTFDGLRASGRIRYQPGMLAVGLTQQGDRPQVVLQNLSTESRQTVTADRVFIACGAVATTRLVMSSLGAFGEAVELQESAQFVLPFVSRAATADPRAERANVLAQLCSVLELPTLTHEPVHLQLYTYNSAFEDALPRWTRPIAAAALRRLTVGLGYLPSSISPRLRLRIGPPASGGGLASMTIEGEHSIRRHSPVLRGVSRLLLKAAPRLDLWPVLPRLRVSAPGKSYHWGGTFPHRAHQDQPWSTDRLGRLSAWDRVHLVDASVLPSIAATTFTLTAMANAHRIASEVRSLAA